MEIELDKEMKIFLKNIYILRTKYNKNKKEMAKILGISIYKLNKLENGILPKSLTCDIFFRIYENFNIHPSMQFKEIL